MIMTGRMYAGQRYQQSLKAAKFEVSICVIMHLQYCQALNLNLDHMHEAAHARRLVTWLSWHHHALHNRLSICMLRTQPSPTLYTRQCAHAQILNLLECACRTGDHPCSIWSEADVTIGEQLTYYHYCKGGHDQHGTCRRVPTKTLCTWTWLCDSFS